MWTVVMENIPKTISSWHGRRANKEFPKVFWRWTTVSCLAPDCLVCVPSSQRCRRCLLSCSFPQVFFLLLLCLKSKLENAACLSPPVVIDWLTKRLRGQRAADASEGASISVFAAAWLSRWRWLVMWNTTGPVQLKRNVLVESCWKSGSDMPLADFSFTLTRTRTLTMTRLIRSAITANAFQGRTWRQRGLRLQTQRWCTPRKRLGLE